MPNYQIKLTPVENFFFGGEKHTRNAAGDRETHYFVESNAYPQQTALLGLIRYYLLLKNNTIFKDNRIISGSNVDDFIGACSFDYNATSTLTYGKISELSPLYMCKGNENYFFAPLDYTTALKNGFIMEKVIKKKNKITRLMEDKLTEYTAKEKGQYITQRLVSNVGNYISTEDVIKDSPQVGNEKTANQAEKENAFYKQNMKRLEKDWSFAIDVELNTESGVVEETIYLPFGGEKCFFKMEIKQQGRFSPTLPQDYGWDKLKGTKPGYDIRKTATLYSIVCISDCFLADTTLLNTCDFAVNEFVSFRNIQSKTATTNKYSGLSSKDKTQLDLSNRFNLLQRGSVLYFLDKGKYEAVKAAIEGQTEASKIGFNQILTNPISII